MCGIAGIVRQNGAITTHEDREAVTRMMHSVKHRGPDSHGIAVSHCAIFGHRRLAILDLSDAGQQPMENETGSVWVVFNGEIYNYAELGRELRKAGHRLASGCDTEVILHGYEEWGIENLLTRLRGMFAFALYDGERAKAGEPFVFLARDRLGIKPLYVTERQGSIAFASEVQALRNSGLTPTNPDIKALVGLLALGSVPSPRTYLKDVRCLMPGHFMAIGPTSVQAKCYWKLDYDCPLTEDMSEILPDAVRRHLISDVPLGAFLSGGLDSGALVALATRVAQTPVFTLTAKFEEHRLNEAETASRVAKLLGTRHNEVVITEREFLDEMERFLQCVDQPTADGVNTYFICRAARSLGLKVVLSGLGGDEVFLGYRHHRALTAIRRLPLAQGQFSKILQNLLRLGGHAWGRTQGQDRWRRFAYLGRRDLAESAYLLFRGFFAPEQICDLLGVDRQHVDDALDESFATMEAMQANQHFDLQRFHQIEMQRYLHDQLLRDSDVFSMAHSVELRVPYLDHEVVEQGCRIPAEQRISKSSNKPKLVEAVGEPFLTSAARRKKQGFTFPMSAWMHGNSAELERMALRSCWLDPAAVRRCWRDFESGRAHWSRAWATVVIASRN